MYETLEIEIRDNIGIITLNRPEKLNAINSRLTEEMLDALNTLNFNQNVEVIIITGRGKAFCAGGDLAEAINMDSPVKEYNWLKSAQRLQISIDESPKIVLAVINGAAMGGGLELALACDIRIASSSAIFSLPEIKVGLLPGGGGMSTLSKVIGIGRAKELILTGRRVNAEEALSIGLVTEVVESDKLMDRAFKYAQELVDKPPIGVKLAKETINLNHQVDLRTGLNNEAKALWILFSTKDRFEGTQAFLQRRKPVFKGE